MFGSQALETAIGLVLMFFVIATLASSVVEVIAAFWRKRAKNFEAAIAAMLTGETKGTFIDGEAQAAVKTAVDKFKQTSIYKSAEAAAGRSLILRRQRSPSYLSAKSFADAMVEMLTSTDNMNEMVPIDQLPQNLQDKLKPIVKEVGADLTRFKAKLEGWFDDTMQRAEGHYKRWTSVVLFVVGLGLAILGNASTPAVANELWQDPVVRAAVIDSAEQVSSSPDALEENLKTVSTATTSVKALKLPIGWDKADKKHWDQWSDPWHWYNAKLVVGWLVTAFLVLLGGPFWFDLLTKLVALRNSGSKPPTAPNDPGSATAEVIKPTVSIAAVAPAGAAPVAVAANADLATRLSGVLGLAVAAPPGP